MRRRITLAVLLVAVLAAEGGSASVPPALARASLRCDQGRLCPPPAHGFGFASPSLVARDSLGRKRDTPASAGGTPALHPPLHLNVTQSGGDSGSAGQDSADQAALQEAAGWIAGEHKIDAEYHYVMTCKLRLLLFWAGSDDVGGGYVRIGKAARDERQQMIQVLFGSDPTKAPLSINRWGAGTEVLRTAGSGDPEASAFFGFMKSSKGQSVLAMRKELSDEKANGGHLFEGIISSVVSGRALSTTVPYTSNRDFDVHQFTEAESAALQQLENNPARHIRRLDGEARRACPRAGEFLSTTLQLIDDAVAGHSTPETLCYIYNARHYHATLVSVHPIAEKKVHVTLRGNGGALDQTYRHLKAAHFEVACEETETKSIFDILLGTEGSLRGAPVQITYQPNWWFQVILNLTPGALVHSGPGQGR